MAAVWEYLCAKLGRIHTAMHRGCMVPIVRAAARMFPEDDLAIKECAKYLVDEGWRNHSQGTCIRTDMFEFCDVGHQSNILDFKDRYGAVE